MSRRISSSSRIRASSGSTRKTSSSTNSSSCDAAWCFGVWAAGEGFFIGGGAGRLRVLLLMAGRGTSVRPQGLECTLGGESREEMRFPPILRAVYTL